MKLPTTKILLNLQGIRQRWGLDNVEYITYEILIAQLLL